MNVELDVPEGKWRHITAAELDEINRLVSNSTKNYEDNKNN
jgi:23S rRNA pseudouridine2604 synthase